MAKKSKRTGREGGRKEEKGIISGLLKKFDGERIFFSTNGAKAIGYP